VTDLQAFDCYVRVQNSHRTAVMGANRNELVAPKVLFLDFPNREAEYQPRAKKISSQDLAGAIMCSFLDLSISD
jgi:hypothetical protein